MTIVYLTGFSLIQYLLPAPLRLEFSLSSLITSDLSENQTSKPLLAALAMGIVSWMMLLK